MPNLFIISHTISRKKLKLYIDGKHLIDFKYSTPVSLKLKEKKSYQINIKEGLTKNHYFDLYINKDILLYIKKKPDIIGSRLAISTDKKFKTLIAWEPEL